MKKILVSVLCLIILLGGGGYLYYHKHHTSSSTPAASPSAAVAEPVRYSGIAGKSALDVLKQTSHHVDSKSYSYGDLVTGIDGVENTSTMSWMMYVNGTLSSEGASSYITQDSDIIEWRYEKSSY